MPATFLYRSAAFAALAAVVMSGVTACKTDTATTAATDPDALPLALGDAPPPSVAPAVEQLPAAPTVRYVPVAQPQQAYRYIDDAYETDEAFDDSPPDYGFNYDGGQPWVWRTAADAWRMVEPAPDGDRYYFYEPGASDPYLVRDASYSYAYSEGRLVNVYDRRGQVLDRIEAERRADWASRYYARARALRAAAAEDRRERVIAAQWAQRQARIERDRADWRREQQQIAEWRAYHARYGEERARRLAEERRHRQQQAIAFRDWRARDYAGPPPRVVARQEAKRDWQFWKRRQHDQQVAQHREDQRRQQLALAERQRAHDEAVRRDQARRDATAHQAEAQRQKQLRDQQAHDQARADAARRQHDKDQARAQAQRQQQLRDQRARAQARADAQRQQRDKAHALAVAEQKRKAAQAAQAKAQQQKADAQARAEQKRKAAQAQSQARAQQAARAQGQARNDRKHRPHGGRDDDRAAPNLARN